MSGDKEGQMGVEYTQDGTVDLKGNPILKSKRGRWRACSFIVVYELFERMAFYGIMTNLVLYLTNKLHQGTVTSANNVTNWTGAVYLTPILGAYVADAHLGRYWTLLISSGLYLFGMCMLTLAVSLPGLKPQPCSKPNAADCEKANALQLAVFYGSLYILALSNGGTKPNISTIGADQFDDFDVKEKKQKLSFFNMWMFNVFLGGLFSATVVVYIQDNVGWTLGYALPTLGLAISFAIFIVGTPFYRHRKPAGSSITIMARVILSSLRKFNVIPPHDPSYLHELTPESYTKPGRFKIESTDSLNFFNKAAVRIGPGPHTSWNLCTVTEVEETKQMMRMVPVLVSTFIPGTITAQVSTLFIKQGTTLDRTFGTIQVPPASVGSSVVITMLISLVIYDRYLVRFIKTYTKNPRGITLLQRMGVGIILHVIIMTTSALVENYRLHIARQHHLINNGGQVPLTIFILLPQFILFGIADVFIEVAKIEFFYDQAPENMKSLGTSFNSTSYAMGNFISTVLLNAVAHLTMRRGKGWILNNLNASRLDLYYAFYAVLGSVNFVFFLIVAKRFVYRAEVSDSMDALGEEGIHI